MLGEVCLVLFDFYILSLFLLNRYYCSESRLKNTVRFQQIIIIYSCHIWNAPYSGRVGGFFHCFKFNHNLRFANH